MTNQPAPKKCCPTCGSPKKELRGYECNSKFRPDAVPDVWHDVLPVEPQPAHVSDHCGYENTHPAHTWADEPRRYCPGIWPAGHDVCTCGSHKLAPLYHRPGCPAAPKAVETVPVVPPEPAMRAAHGIQSEIAPVDLMWGSDEVAAKIAGIIQRELAHAAASQAEGAQGGKDGACADECRLNSRVGDGDGSDDRVLHRRVRDAPENAELKAKIAEVERERDSLLRCIGESDDCPTAVLATMATAVCREEKRANKVERERDQAREALRGLLDEIDGAEISHDDPPWLLDLAKVAEESRKAALSDASVPPSEDAKCTCPTKVWTGDEMSESTCEINHSDAEDAPATPQDEKLVITIARELYDRFVMGGWEPQDAYPAIRAWLGLTNAAEPAAQPAGKEAPKE